eukprot:TRINITY_DN5920_c0_g1_i1.p1 TRINITY_DN5920_c0_g1~~TRINITY_DN5920_c0_g1_i1.p1  ORF type:complete len:53 (-),score=0.68 TRINITY_DN5920_c0_g1_i1:131-289(-)
MLLHKRIFSRALLVLSQKQQGTWYREFESQNEERNPLHVNCFQFRPNNSKLS